MIWFDSGGSQEYTLIRVESLVKLILSFSKKLFDYLKHQKYISKGTLELFEDSEERE